MSSRIESEELGKPSVSTLGRKGLGDECMNEMIGGHVGTSCCWIRQPTITIPLTQSERRQETSHFATTALLTQSRWARNVIMVLRVALTQIIRLMFVGLYWIQVGNGVIRCNTPRLIRLTLQRSWQLILHDLSLSNLFKCSKTYSMCR